MFGTTELYITLVFLLAMLPLFIMQSNIAVSKQEEYRTRLNALLSTYNGFCVPFQRFVRMVAEGKHIDHPEVQQQIQEMIVKHCQILMTQPVRQRYPTTTDMLVDQLTDKAAFLTEEGELLEASRTLYLGKDEDL